MINPLCAELFGGNIEIYLYHFFRPRWSKYAKSFLQEHKELFILNGQYNSCWCPVASFTKEVNPWLAKCQLVFNGPLANLWLTPSVKEATSDSSILMKLAEKWKI